MSNYPPSFPNPSPPPPGPWYGTAQPDPLAAGRRAAVLGWVLGGLMLLGGFCVGVFAVAGPQQFIEAFEQSSGRSDVTPEMIRIVLIVMAVIIVLYSLATIVLGIFVWRGSFGATVTAIVFALVAAIVALVNALGSVTRIRSAHGGAEMGGLFCGIVVIPVAFVAHVVLLFQAARGARQQRRTREQYQAQVWQHQQYQQMYGQPGYGYPPPAQPPPPPPSEQQP